MISVLPDTATVDLPEKVPLLNLPGYTAWYLPLSRVIFASALSFSTAILGALDVEFAAANATPSAAVNEMPFVVIQPSFWSPLILIFLNVTGLAIVKESSFAAGVVL